jgi:hypothetical protein
MTYLNSADDTPSGAGRSKTDTYVLKQAAWAKEVAAYQHAQAQALERLAPAPGATTAQIKASQEKYMQWLQEHARDHKNSIQTKYMDWVVHGYKFLVGDYLSAPTYPLTPFGVYPMCVIVLMLAALLR